MEIALGMALGILILAVVSLGYLVYGLRNDNQRMRAFIENPNVKAVDKQQQYKETYEAKVNALENERREQFEAITEAFDYLNDNGPFGSHDAGLKQVRNVLLRAIQTSTYGR